MRIFFGYGDTPSELNCSRYNCFFPAKAINKLEGHHADTLFVNDFTSNTEEAQKICNEADLILIERNLFFNTPIRMLEYRLKAKNVAVIFDDAYHVMEKDNASYSFWHGNQITIKNEKDEFQQVSVIPPILEQFKLGLKISKGLICPSPVLCNDWKHIIPTYPIHNYIDEDRYPIDATPLFPHDKKEIYIGWCGSMSHVESFVNSGVLQALIYVARKYDHVKIMLTGDKRNYDNLNLPESKKVYSGYVQDELWCSLLRSLDIGIAPLNSEYDKRRSWVKVLEYIYLKIPWIATNFETYHELEEYGILTENGMENWKKALCEMVENIDKARELANGKAYKFGLTQTYDKNVDKLLETYQKIIDAPFSS